MADPFLIFPGTTDHISTEDQNRSDADTAHLYQSIGSWGRLGGASLEREANAEGTYGYVLRGNPGTSTLRIRNGSTADHTTLFAVSGSTEYSVSIRCKPSVAARIRIVMNQVDSSNTVIVNGAEIPGAEIDPAVPGAWVTIEGTFTSEPTAVGVQVLLYWSDSTQGGDPCGDADILQDVTCFAEGTDATFTPSLRVVGDMYEEQEPSDMPVVFAGDGTPLTVGEGWAGNGYHYRRYDGPGASDPLVAQFQASDIPTAAQLPT